MMTGRRNQMAPKVSRIGLGTVQFGTDYGVSNTGGEVPVSEVARILAFAHQAGIEVLDTAASYGKAEEAIGVAMQTDHRFRIVTKALPLSHGLDAVEKRARASLALLGRKPVDAILVHAAQDLGGPDGARLWSLLQRLRDEGLYERIGISAYVDGGPLDLARRYRPDLMQVPFSLLDQRIKRSGVLEALKALDIEVHVRSIFLQGLLLMDPGQLPGNLTRSEATLAATRARIRQAGLTPIEAALGFVLGQEEVDIALVGVTRQTELSEIVTASEAKVPKFDWEACAIEDPVTLTPSLW
jgi:aryl-alcohol dehydrogenase-like predicted oxidoreductase